MGSIVYQAWHQSPVCVISVPSVCLTSYSIKRNGVTNRTSPYRTIQILDIQYFWFNDNTVSTKIVSTIITCISIPQTMIIQSEAVIIIISRTNNLRRNETSILQLTASYTESVEVHSGCALELWGTHKPGFRPGSSQDGVMSRWNFIFVSLASIK